MTDTTDDGTVLVVDDDEDVADTYAIRLREHYAVRVAYGGEEALDRVDDEVDVVLLDRRMPDLSGDDVLDAVRERGLDVRVIMVTAVDPDFDIVDMPFDDYLCKPVDAEDMVAAIDGQLRMGGYADDLAEYFRLSSKLAVLETEKSAAELERSDEYARLQRRKEDLEAALDRTLDEVEEVADAFRDIDRSGWR